MPKLTDCKGCHGHGYYLISADAAGTKRDVKKKCRDCSGTGKKPGGGFGA